MDTEVYLEKVSALIRFRSRAARVQSPSVWKTGWTINVRPSTEYVEAASSVLSLALLFFVFFLGKVIWFNQITSAEEKQPCRLETCYGPTARLSYCQYSLPYLLRPPAGGGYCRPPLEKAVITPQTSFCGLWPRPTCAAGFRLKSVGGREQVSLAPAQLWRPGVPCRV